MKNIYEVLGKVETWRSQFFQLVKDWGEVTVQKYKQEFPYQLEWKYDGNYAAVVVQGGECLGVFSRQGKPFNNIDKLGKQMAKAKKDGVYMAEVYVEKQVAHLQKFAACISPFRKRALTGPEQAIVDAAKLALFDYVTIEEFLELDGKRSTGFSPLPQDERRARLLKSVRKVVDKFDNIHLTKMVIVEDDETLQAYAAAAITQGAEGVVIKSVRHPWDAGHKNYYWMKIVKEVEYDLECVGYVEGKGKFEGAVGTLQFRFKDGKTIGAGPGTGWDMDSLTELCKSAKKDKKGKTPVGQIFRVGGLEDSSEGSIRNSKFYDTREDKGADF